jgi:hypothetical protein
VVTGNFDADNPLAVYRGNEFRLGECSLLPCRRRFSRAALVGLDKHTGLVVQLIKASVQRL